MNTGWTSRLPSVSLRELLGVIAFLAVACAAMVHPTELWVTVLATFVMIVGAIAIILAAILRGRTQAFAIGFAAVLACYLLGVQNTRPPYIVSTLGTTRFVDSQGRLPTSILLANLWWRMRTPYYFDGENRPIEPYDGTLEEVESRRAGRFTAGSAIKPPSSFGQPGGPTVYNVSLFPILQTVLNVGHLLFALAFGYLGGKFAVWVYLRRVSREDNSIEATQL